MDAIIIKAPIIFCSVGMSFSSKQLNDRVKNTFENPRSSIATIDDARRTPLTINTLNENASAAIHSTYGEVSMSIENAPSIDKIPAEYTANSINSVPMASTGSLHCLQ